MKSIYSVVILSLVLLIIACQEKAMSPATPEEPDFSLTPMENEEAEEAAIQLSGELIAPVPLYNRIRRELELIRLTWQDSIQFVNLKFELLSDPSKLNVRLTREAYDSIVASRYHYWDSLNEFYRIESKELILINSYILMKLNFYGRLNSIVLGKAYSGLPGFMNVETIAFGTDRSMVWLLKEEDVIKYFFRYGYGDCQAGCVYSDIYYFTVNEESAIFHGSFLFYAGYTEIPPVWLDTAFIAFREYSTWYQWRTN